MAEQSAPHGGNGGRQGDSGDGEHVAFQGKKTTVRVKRVTHPNGHVSQYEIVERPDAVAVVALRAGADGEPEVALVSQRRPAVGQELLELPAGLIEPDERGHPERTAARELREETGCDADDLRPLIAEYSSPGFTTERISIFVAAGIHEAPGGQQLDPGEQIKVHWTPLDDALAQARDGRISDGKTLLGLWLARDEVAAGSIEL